MATPVFGFSVGDFISAINLVNKVRKSLKDVGGAASEYQSAVIELENLATTFSHLEALQPNEDNVQHVNAIRAMAMACKVPLEEFTRKLKRYESSLGSLARQKSLYTIGQKTKWSVTFAEDVEKLRALVAAKHVSINLLLGMQTSKTLSKLSAEMRSSIQSLEERIAKHHAILHSVQERTQSMDDRTRLAQVADHEILESVYAGVDRMDHSVVEARHSGKQLMDYLNAFSGKIQGHLQSNLQTYQLMLQTQQNIAPRPTNLLKSNIRFEDALGEIKELPYEYFRHWEPFEGFLRAHFRHKPGESKILNSQYHIIDGANKKAVIKKDHWTRYIREGATISMSMIMSYVKLQSGVCPRPGCSAAGLRAEGFSNTLYCKTCCLESFQLENNLEDSFERITVLPEDEEVAKKQIDEDMSLYGSRPTPPDALKDDEHTQLSNLPPKRGVAESDEADTRPAKVRKTEQSKGTNHQRITAMDWNSGATPLNAWLNQSAVPSIVPLPQTQNYQSDFSSDDLAAKELEDLKIFRTIHIERIAEPKSIGSARKSVIDLTILEPRAQIYLRNILDRYPLLPLYLALRLAKANCARANRLDRTRHNRGDQLTSKPEVSEYDRLPPNKRESSIDDVAQILKPLRGTQAGMSPNLPPQKTDKPRPYSCATCNRPFRRLEHLKRHERSHAKEEPFVCEQCKMCFARGNGLIRHQAMAHRTPSSESRYHVTLNAPTAMIRQADEIPVTYLNKCQAYVVTIHDSEKTGFSRYRTVVHVSFDDEERRQNPSAYWQLWKEAREKLQAVEFLGIDQGGYATKKAKPRIELETASLDSFSIIWSSSFDIAIASCSILIQFNFLSTDFSHSKGVKGIPVRLYAKTDTLSNSTLNSLSGPTAESCFCKIMLFGCNGAERKLSIDKFRIEKLINKREQQIALVENDDKNTGSASKGAIHRSGKFPEYKQTWSVSSQDSNGRSAAEHDLHTELAKLRDVLSSIRPMSVLKVKGGERVDPGMFPVSSPGRSRSREQRSPRISCMICSKFDHHSEDCPNRIHESSTSHANAGFWTSRGLRPRAASVHSQSSERNSSLHGSGRLDDEDQDLFLLNDRSRQSSASFSESSPAFPPPPVYIESERYPPADGIVDQVPKPLRLFCDICGQDIEVLRRRDWQIHVLQDLRPYLCTVENCDEPTTQFNSRRSLLLHEIRSHEMELGVFDPDLLERKLRESATGVCLFCGEQTEGKINSREKHIGRHMEEIAFAVVRKPYEEWDFYSDSSDPAHHGIVSDHQAKHENASA